MATVVSECDIGCVLPTQCTNDPLQARAWAVATLQCLAPVPIAPDRALIGRVALSRPCRKSVCTSRSAGDATSTPAWSRVCDRRVWSCVAAAFRGFWNTSICGHTTPSARTRRTRHPAHRGSAAADPGSYAQDARRRWSDGIWLLSGRGATSQNTSCSRCSTSFFRSGGGTGSWAAPGRSSPPTCSATETGS